MERQATVDAAAFALFIDDIYRFTKGKVGQSANVALCEQVLQLGKRLGIFPYSFPKNNVTASGALDKRRSTSAD